MDYSVGSLADLISGVNTPNKPKVVKKKFKKDDQISMKNTTISKKSPKKNIKEESVVEPIIPSKKVKKEFKRQKNGLVKSKSELISTKKVKKEISKQKKSFVKTKSEFNEAENDKSTENEFPSENKTVRKRKRHSESNETTTAEDEASLPKQQKLSINEENATRRIKKKVKEEAKIVEDPEVVERTIFVGNIPITCNKKQIKKHFKKYGDIETVRIRGIPVANLKTSKKIAAIKKEFNPNRSNVFCYVRFVNKESVSKAEVENGSLFEDHHLRVHSCVSKEKPDETKAIFVGNLSFNAVEDELWKLFEPCGPISYVRIVRDSYTGIGKGFGYVNFMDSDAVQLALQMENVKLNDRELRISLCNLNSARKNKKNNKKRKIQEPGKEKVRSKFTNQQRKKVVKSGDEVVPIKSEFQGTKFNDKKKRKVNKGLLEKKKLVKKIAPKPK